MVCQAAHRQRVATNLGYAQLELLDRLSREAKFSGGAKLSQALILGTLVDVLSQLPVDVTGVRTREDLQARILDAIRKFR
ncbi:MAG: hypothetical protein M0T85_12760 [Dehalococcoidales bacterium]|nr:hypothetical protein [Dehalococcoidales bacterium]